MAKQKKQLHRVEMTEGKRNIIRQRLEEDDIAEDIQDALKDLIAVPSRQCCMLKRQFISSIFYLSSTIRRVIYTTNAIESLNSTHRKLNHQRSVFLSNKALLKSLYLDTFEATKNGATSFGISGQVYGEVIIIPWRSQKYSRWFLILYLSSVQFVAKNVIFTRKYKQ